LFLRIPLFSSFLPSFIFLPPRPFFFFHLSFLLVHPFLFLPFISFCLLSLSFLLPPSFLPSYFVDISFQITSVSCEDIYIDVYASFECSTAERGLRQSFLRFQDNEGVLIPHLRFRSYIIFYFSFYFVLLTIICS
jgi:hypothetical protein